MEGKRRRITSIDYRPDGEEVLVSFSSDYIYTFDPRVKDFIRYLIEEIGCSIRDP
jgi:hypothetical protein